MSEEFSGWAIVEVMGHHKYVGMVEEATLAGAGVLRVDVPEVSPRGLHQPGIRAFTKFIPPSSLYALTPITEEEAQIAIERIRSTPHSIPMITADPWIEDASSHYMDDEERRMYADRDDEDLDFEDL